MRCAWALLAIAGCRFDLPEGPPDASDRSTCAPVPPTVLTAYNHTTAPTGSRTGSACLDSGCHNSGGAGGTFAFAGTVYKDTSGVIPAPGVTIRIFKPGNATSLASLVTDTAGNFLLRGTAGFTAFPYDTHVTACGASQPIRPMITPITAAETNCNLGGSCHGSGGNAGAINLPD